MGTATTNRDYPIPLSTDPVDVPSDMQALGNAIDSDVAGILSDYLDTTSLAPASFGALATGFTSAAGTLRYSLNKQLINLDLTVVSTNTLTATAGNITDINCFTLISDFRPSEIKGALITSTAQTGSANIGTDGHVTLISSSDTITAGSTVRISATYLRDA